MPENHSRILNQIDLDKDKYNYICNAPFITGIVKVLKILYLP
jgi:hypothetical protein